MKTRVSYTYSILRYVHDIPTGEFVNVGVAVHCAKENYFNVIFRSTSGRVSEFFPDIKTDAFKALLKSLSTRFKDISDVYSSPMNFGDKPRNLEEILKSVTPKDDSALVWTDISSGLSDSPQKTLEKLYSRYVAKYDHKKTQHHRTDEDVWRSFKKDLTDRKIQNLFEEKVITGKDDEVKFPFAWKNGIWHCVEPLSFDLSAAESIRDKAHKCLGKISSINKDAHEQFKLYLLISKPIGKGLDQAFARAVSILEKMPVTTEIFYEEQRVDLIDKFAAQISNHNTH